MGFFARRKLNNLGMRSNEMGETAIVMQHIFATFATILVILAIARFVLGFRPIPLILKCDVNPFSSCRPRTCLDFISDKEIWRDVELWANKENYKLKSHSETERIYKGNGLFDTGYHLLVCQDGDKVHIEAWVQIGFYSIEVAIDEATLFTLANERRFVRPFNRLLTRLRIPVRIRESVKARAIWDFTASSKDIWSDVEYWAKEEGYKLKNRSGEERIYKRYGFFGGFTSCLLVRHDVGMVYVEAWVYAGLFSAKQEIAADEADMLSDRLWKDNTRRINSLLATLGSPVMIASA
jgi:hypothetical protein